MDLPPPGELRVVRVGGGVGPGAVAQPLQGAGLAAGRVHLTYRTHTPTNVNADPTVHAVYRALTTAGAPSGTPLELYAPSDASVAAFSTLAGQRFRFFGDYAGIAASSTAANPIWDHSQNFAGQSANPTNTHQRSFSARVQ